MTKKLDIREQLAIRMKKWVDDYYHAYKEAPSSDFMRSIIDDVHENLYKSTRLKDLSKKYKSRIGELEEKNRELMMEKERIVREFRSWLLRNPLLSEMTIDELVNEVHDRGEWDYYE